MTNKNKKRILNGVMIIACLFLIGTAWEAFSRSRTQSDYELLAKQRVDREAELKPATTQGTLITINDPITKPTNLGLDEKGNALDIKETKDPLWIKNENSVWLNLNPDFLGWVKVPGTEIDYPYVRSQDNQEYLKQDFYRQPSKAGTLFMDYRNLSNVSDDHVLIYGHNMKNGTMFHDLVKYHDKEFYKENQEITVSNLYGTKRYRVFSVYEISADDYQLPVGFKTKSERDDYLNMLIAQSMHRDEENEINQGQILSLITCSYGENNGRTIVHAWEIGD